METDPAADRRLVIHRALADPTRLRLVDALALSDRTPGELRRLVHVPSNLLAFHLGVLEEAGLVARSPSEGDGRRRYVTLTALGWPHTDARLAPPRALLFVCSRNAARSQLAAALWRARTGQPAHSAGAQPAGAIDADAVALARAHGLALEPAPPRGYADVETAPDLVVSVCDRAGEGEVPFDATRLHWSVADPHGRDEGAYATTFDELARRIDRLAAAVAA